MIRPWFLVFALWLFLAIVLAVNVYHYATAMFGGVP